MHLAKWIPALEQVTFENFFPLKITLEITEKDEGRISTAIHQRHPLWPQNREAIVKEIFKMAIFNSLMGLFHRGMQIPKNWYGYIVGWPGTGFGKLERIGLAVDRRIARLFIIQIGMNDVAVKCSPSTDRL